MGSVEFPIIGGVAANSQAGAGGGRVAGGAELAHEHDQERQDRSHPVEQPDSDFPGVCSPRRRSRRSPSRIQSRPKCAWRVGVREDRSRYALWRRPAISWPPYNCLLAFPYSSSILDRSVDRSIRESTILAVNPGAPKMTPKWAGNGRHA